MALWLGRQASPHTKRNYRRQASAFLDHVGKPLAAVTLGDVLGYVAQPRRPRLGHAGERGGHREVAALLRGPDRLPARQCRGGGEGAVGEEHPGRAHPRRGRRHARARPGAEPRNRALLTLLYGAGLRISEVCGLRWRDLVARDTAGQVTVYGKGGKTRVVLLSARTWALLDGIRGDGEPDDPVFRSRKGGGALDASAVHRVVKAAAARAELAPEVSAHWLRHAHASHALDRGAPVHLVQATLGHASVATTGRYLHARPTDSSARYLAV